MGLDGSLLLVYFTALLLGGGEIVVLARRNSPSHSLEVARQRKAKTVSRFVKKLNKKSGRVDLFADCSAPFGMTSCGKVWFSCSKMNVQNQTPRRQELLMCAKNTHFDTLEARLIKARERNARFR